MKWTETKRTLDILNMKDGKLRVWLKMQKYENGDCRFVLNYEAEDKELYDTITGFETLVFSEKELRDNDRILQLARTISTMMPSSLNAEYMPIRGIMQFMDCCYFDVSDFIEMVYQYKQKHPGCEPMLTGLMLNLHNFVRNVRGVNVRNGGPKITLLSDFMSYILWWGENESKENLTFGTHKEHSTCLAGILDLLSGNGSFIARYDSEDENDEEYDEEYDEVYYEDEEF